jgi:hypothetical protein
MFTSLTSLLAEGGQGRQAGHRKEISICTLFNFNIFIYLIASAALLEFFSFVFCRYRYYLDPNPVDP